jgi:hypothetical protein
LATCRIRIDFDESKRFYTGGEPISGKVIVVPDNDVRCKGLVVRCFWATHGRGNVTQGQTDTAVLFDGDWISGKEYQYPFKLNTAAWPPTHYGNLINVSHFVEAQAKLPWAMDPKKTAEFTVIAIEAPENSAPATPTVNNFWVKLILAPIAVAVLLLFIPILMMLLPLVAIISLVYWLFKVVIPGRITGKVQFATEPAVVLAGESISGFCEFTPKSTSPIQGITWTVTCTEKCVSGSGTKQKTHTHPLVSQVYELAPAGTLKSGERQRFEFKFPVPTTAHPTLKLTHNEILWSSEFRIDIPKWPDWVKEIPFVVKPTKQLQPLQDPVSPIPSPTSFTSTNNDTPASDEDRWLTQVLQQVLQSDGDTKRLEDVLDAIENQTFQVTLDLREESDELTPSLSGQADLEEDGAWLHAMDVQRNIKVALYVSGADELETLEWRKNWKGEVAIVGLDSLSQRVLMKSIAPSR